MHKGCRCFHPSGRIYIVKTAHFDESDFPYHSLFSAQSSSSHSPKSIIVNGRLLVNNMSHLLPHFTTHNSFFPDVTTESLSSFNHTNDIPYLLHLTYLFM